MHLYDLTPADQLAWLTENGYVREVEHPSEPLNLLNYTDRAMTKPELFRHQPALNHTRGLIYNRDTGEIVARPFKKFWNYGQEQAAEIRLTDCVQVHDKVDGSLGILYRRPSDGQLAVATRGSFTSPQALVGTELLQNYSLGVSGDETLLFEIIYPENRIVLDYGNARELRLLGSVEIESGAVSGPSTAAIDSDWSGPVAETFFGGSFAEAMTLPMDRPNAEGYVIRVTKGSPNRAGHMVKLKQEDYLELHRIVFGLSTRSIWAALRGGKSQTEILESLPDEFHGWTLDVIYELWNLGVCKRYRDLTEAYRNTMSYAFKSGIVGLNEDEPTGYYVDREHRGALARLFAEHGDDQWAMFALLDGKEVMDRLWRDAEPPAFQTPSTYEPGKGPHIR